MKTTTLAATLICFAATLQPTMAQSAKPADKPAQAQALTPAEFDKQLAQMRDYMTQMQSQMEQIAQTRDPQERQRLLQDHWTSMQSAMSVMHGMWGPGGAGCCVGARGMTGPGMMMGSPTMGWGQMHGYYSALTPEQLKQRQYMMDQYLPMQQMMMDHMMWHQRWMSPPPPAPTK